MKGMKGNTRMKIKKEKKQTLTKVWKEFNPYNSEKSLGYAYPTSDIAKQFGFKKEGCWYIKLISKESVSSENKVWSGNAHSDLLTVWKAYQNIPFPINRWCMTENRNFKGVLDRAFDKEDLKERT